MKKGGRKKRGGEKRGEGRKEEEGKEEEKIEGEREEEGKKKRKRRARRKGGRKEGRGEKEEEKERRRKRRGKEGGGEKEEDKKEERKRKRKRRKGEKGRGEGGEREKRGGKEGGGKERRGKKGAGEKRRGKEGRGEKEEDKKEEEKKEVTYEPKELEFTAAGGLVQFITKNGTTERQALKIIEVTRHPGNPKIDKLVLIHTPAAAGEVDAPPLFKKPIAYQTFIIPLALYDGVELPTVCTLELFHHVVSSRRLAWIEHYEKELKNFEEFGDEGEIWFGRVAENRMVKYVIGNEQLSKSCKLIDFGCGNGSLLRALRQEGYSHLCGVDYSEEAILLARKLAERKCLENSTDQIDFRGTWDALSLSVDRDCRLRKYKTNICRTLRPFGNELESHFSSEELEFSEEIPSRNIIEFGGRSGSTTTCVIFRRV
ncbi:hypothetical protein DINM_001742 [Dirofilaria immitis]|nr:hypothetical protein [Dirofilaria immitis]